MASASVFGIGGWDPIGSIGEGMLNSLFAEHAAEQSFERQKELAELNYQNNLRAMREGPQAMREGLVAAGYNPILAVNSAGGASFSNSVPGGPQASFSPSNTRGDVSLDGFAKMAMIRQTEAQTELVKKRTLGEGWQIKTLSRAEAQGLGASLVHTLGFNFHDSSQQTFLVAYNPITGELRNLGDTESGLGSTAPASNAADVQVIPVDWNTDRSPRYKFNPDDWQLKPEYRK